MSRASRVGSINVLLTTSFGGAVDGLNTFAGAVERTGERSRRAVMGIDKSMIGMNRTMRGIGGGASGFRGLAISALRTRDSIGQMNAMLLATGALLGGLVPVLSGAYLVKMADRAHLMANSLRTVTETSTELKSVQAALFDVSQRTRTSFEGSVTMYSRLARATEAFGLSQQRLLRITETINKAFAVGGATPQEAQGAAIQLSQGIASNRFSGEEFRSVAENAPVLLKGIADSLGVTIGRLREMAHAGELTARVVTEAIEKASSSIDEDFAKTTSTIGQAMVRLDNAILKYVSDSETVAASSAAVVTVINAVADNMGTVTDAVLAFAGALVLTFGGRRLAEMAAYQAAVSRGLALQRAATAAALDRAKAEAAVAKAQMAQAGAFAKMSATGNVTPSTRNAALKEHAQAVVRYRDAQAQLATATNASAKALQAASLSGRMFAATGAIASSAWAFIGGPIGAALLAAGAAMFVMSKNSAEASARMSRYNDVITDSKGRTLQTAEAIREAAAALKDFGALGSVAALQAQMNTAADDASELASRLTHLGLFFSKTEESMMKLGRQLVSGSISLEEYMRASDGLARSDSGYAERISALQKEAASWVAATDEVDRLSAAIDNIDGKTADVAVNVRVIPADVKSKIAKDLREQAGDILKSRIEDGKSISDFQARFYGDVLDGVTKKNRRKTDAEKSAERFADALKKLDMQIAGSQLPELDRKTLEAAESAGIAESKIRAFIEAARSGGDIPEELERIRSRLEQIAQIEFNKKLGELEQSNVVMFLSDLDREVVSTARSFDIAEEKISAFIRAAAAGSTTGFPEELARIRAELEKGVANQQKLDVIDGFADIVGNLASDLFADPGNGRDIFQGALESLKKLLFQLLIVEPLVRSIRMAMYGSAGGGGDPWAGMRTVGVKHDGGQAGEASAFRAVSLAEIGNYQKFHSGKRGVGYDEVMALLHKSESVFTKDDTSAMAAGLARGMTAARNGDVYVSVQNNNGSAIDTRGSGTAQDPLEIIVGAVNQGMKQGKFDKSMGGRYGARPSARQR